VFTFLLIEMASLEQAKASDTASAYIAMLLLRDELF
jgi:hypothetical protein